MTEIGRPAGAARGLRRVWRGLPAAARKRLYAPAKELVRARALLAELRSREPLHSLRLVGPPHGGGPPLSLALLGDATDCVALGRLLGPGAAREDESLVPPRSANAWADAALLAADLVLCHLPRWTRPPPSFLVAPGSVEVVVPVAAAMRALAADAAPLGKYRRRNLREGVRIDLRTDRVSLERYHRDIYLPYLERRFGRAGRPHALSSYALWEGHWELLLAITDAGVVAGGTAIRHEDRYRFLTLAFRDEGNGAGHAIYRAAIERAHALGYDWLDLGPERPLLGDPVLGYKRQWRARLRPDAWSTRQLVVGFRRATPALCQLLSRSPLVLERGRDLVGLTLGPDLDAARAVARRFADLGLAEFRLALGSSGEPTIPV